MLWPVRIPLADVARVVDRTANSHDLFLTATLLTGSAGEYQGLVGKAAEERAAKIIPQQAVPWDNWQQPTVFAASLISVLLLTGWWCPSLDPFGKKAEATHHQQTKKLLEEQKKANDQRKLELAKTDLSKENSDELEKALQILKQDLNKMRPEKKAENHKLLTADREMFRHQMSLTQEQLKNLMKDPHFDQSFGGEELDALRRIKKELQMGSSEGAQKEMEAIQKLLERLSKIEDPVERSEKEREILKKIKKLADFAQKEAGSKALSSALQRAMQQLDALKADPHSKEAMEGLRESMELAKSEFKQLAQNSRDLKSLEDALKLLGMADKLNQSEQLDGELTEGKGGLADYEELYRSLMAGMPGNGEGMGEEGQGSGGKAPEDDSIETNFKDEKSKSLIQKGKILMTTKVKGTSDEGKVVEDYKAAIRDIRQSAADAIESEQVPPGYHEGIKKYFDTLKGKDE